MTESEWLTCNDPISMLTKIVRNAVPLRYGEPGGKENWASERKLRLFGCTCARYLWSLLTDKRSRDAVEVVEKYVDGLATNTDLTIASSDAHEVVAAMTQLQNFGDSDSYYSSWVVRWLTRKGLDIDLMISDAISAGMQEATICDILREIIGNPYKRGLYCVKCGLTDAIYDAEEGGRGHTGCWWKVTDIPTIGSRYLTPIVVNMSQEIYTDKDFRLLPILADALEDQGCQRRDVLDHLRSTGPHVKGCWALDLVLCTS